MDVQTTRPEPTPIPVSEAERFEAGIRRRNRVSCDLFLAKLLVHHPEQAATFLSSIKPRSVDLEPPSAPPPPVRIPSFKDVNGSTVAARKVMPLPVATMANGASEYPTMREIAVEVADFYAVSLRELLSSSRRQVISRPRQIAFYLGRELTVLSTSQIARFFAGRDHSTIVHGVTKITKLMETSERLRDELDVLRLRIQTTVLNALVPTGAAS